MQDILFSSCFLVSVVVSVYHCSFVCKAGASIIFPQENKSVSLAMNKGKYLDQICCNIWRYNRVLLLFWSHSHEENCIYRAYLYRSDSSITYIVYNCCNNVYVCGVALWVKEWVVCKACTASGLRDAAATSLAYPFKKYSTSRNFTYSCSLFDTFTWKQGNI